MAKSIQIMRYLIGIETECTNQETTMLLQRFQAEN